MLLLYLGPEVLMPLVSAIAAIAGGVMMFWHKIRKGARSLLGKKDPDPVTITPDSDTTSS
jgi:hypothetical protein